MEQPKHIVFKCSSLYDEEGFAPEGTDVVDFRSQEGCNCYCSPQAEGNFRLVLEHLPQCSVKWIDTGDYHYISRFTSEYASHSLSGKPFALVVFDNHPDMQPPSFGDMLSCGSWARDAFASVEGLRQVLLLGIDPNLELEFLDLVFDGVIASTSEDFRHTGDAVGKDVEEMMSLLDDKIPVYISIDLDVLGRDYARTDWSHGYMTLSQLETSIGILAKSHPVLGVDICGGITREKGASDTDLALNLKTRKELYDFLQGMLNIFRV